MFDTILLLAGAAEQSILPLALRGHNPLLTVIPVGTAAELDALASDLLRRARLIAFVTAEIVPPGVLARLGYGAFNFHPGPPSYPGWAPAHFALYDEARQFGATLHVMVEQVDAGPIIDVGFFPVPADISVFGLEGLAYAHLAQLFWRWAKLLATDATPPGKTSDRMGQVRRQSFRDHPNHPFAWHRISRRDAVSGAAGHLGRGEPDFCFPIFWGRTDR
jgi:methionyl-tRNA formyltransferase